MDVRLNFVGHGKTQRFSDMGTGWIHFVLIITGTEREDEILAYVNGEKQPKTYRDIDFDGDGAPGPLTITPYDVYNLWDSLDSFDAFDYVDDLIFWNRTLSDSEVEMLYSSYTEQNDETGDDDDADAALSTTAGKLP